ncbi:MAG TPA: hypothetical protein VFJ07_22695 [Streptosporangiaceae bacterium]|nr:hypothetical protein [Streptosporangiaceae bacterium]
MADRKGRTAMPFCTLVEFEWSQSFGRGQFTAALGEADPDGELPAGCLSRITSIDDAGARVIEVWRSGDDARAFAEQSRPALAAAQLPAPARAVGFETTSYRVAGG